MRFRSVLVVAFLCATAAWPARADDCATLLNAMITQAGNPYAANVTMDVPGQPPRTLRTIYVHETIYTELNGKWRFLPMASKDMIGKIRDAAKASKESCHLQGVDKVNGRPAKLYITHVENNGAASDHKLWVMDGKIMKSEAQLAGGMHLVTVFDYSHIAPPADATPIAPAPQQH